MPVEFKLPDLGEGIHEGEIIEVLVAAGDTVEDGQPILVVETDKATTEVPSPVSGKVAEILVKPGDAVKVGQVLMTFMVEGEADGRKPAAKVAAPEELEKFAKKEVKPPRDEAPKQREKARSREETPEPEERIGPVPAAPSTRRLARELGLNIRQVTPSGPGGRVTPEDVRAFADKGAKAAEEPAAPPRKEEGIPLAPAVVSRAEIEDHARWGPVERIPLKSVRRATARHMVLAWSQIPHVAHQDAADITDLESFRRRHKAGIEEQGGALSLTVFALKAAVAALKAYPRFNSSLDAVAEEIVTAPDGADLVESPLGGSVWKILVEPGQSVAAGEVIAVVEAMKTECDVASPTAGVVSHVYAREKQPISAGAPIAAIQPA
jgi:pyruvate dehydrogenase E2 component (dihydrolipoamide acetyltransferase)